MKNKNLIVTIQEREATVYLAAGVEKTVKKAKSALAVVTKATEVDQKGEEVK